MEIKINTQTKTLTIVNQINIKEFKELLERFSIDDDWNVVSDYNYQWHYIPNYGTYTIPCNFPLDSSKFNVTCLSGTSANNIMDTCTTVTCSAPDTLSLPKEAFVVEKEIN